MKRIPTVLSEDGRPSEFVDHIYTRGFDYQTPVFGHSHKAISFTVKMGAENVEQSAQGI